MTTEGKRTRNLLHFLKFKKGKVDEEQDDSDQESDRDKTCFVGAGPPRGGLEILRNGGEEEEVRKKRAYL